MAHFRPVQSANDEAKRFHSVTLAAQLARATDEAVKVPDDHDQVLCSRRPRLLASPHPFFSSRVGVRKVLLTCKLSLLGCHIETEEG